MAGKVSKSHVEEIKKLQKAEKEGKSSSTQKSRLSELRKYYSKQREWATGKTEKNISTGGSGNYWKPEKGHLTSKESIKKSIESKGKTPVGTVRNIINKTYAKNAPKWNPVGIVRDIMNKGKKLGGAGGSKGRKK